VGLPATAVNLRQGALRVVGKGGKERLVPLGAVAQDWLERYVGGARGALARGAAAPWLFVDARGAALTRQAFWRPVKRHAAAAGIDPARVSPHGPRPRLPPPRP